MVIAESGRQFCPYATDFLLLRKTQASSRDGRRRLRRIVLCLPVQEGCAKTSQNHAAVKLHDRTPSKVLEIL